MFDQEDELPLLEKVEKQQRSLVGYATQDGGGLAIADFIRLRQEIVSDGRLQGKIPDIIRKHRDPEHFWQFIKYDQWGRIDKTIHALPISTQNPACAHAPFVYPSDTACRAVALREGGRTNPSMQCPKRKRIPYVKPGIPIINQI